MRKKQKPIIKAIDKDTGLFDKLYQKQNKNISLGHGIMGALFGEMTSIKQLNRLKKRRAKK